MEDLRETVIIPVTASELYSKVSDLNEDGYRLVQACCTKVSEGFEIIYSFDKEHELLNLKLTIPEEEEIMSITGITWSAFIYENEMQDLFGVKFKHMSLNYGGHFFKVSQPTPWNPKN
ncbi:NADH-quinone oxidoreductase subunit C [Anaerovorax odorimutans]|uniref:NADH-quinone oxidoreductase subunit C n=1 Tax=Anaerovorax odorimutans TaxID=109327 RepID=UPI0003FAC723|nr:NADH-quinone oxidoreductase subunit C [Anaerovorax odorimutans]